MSDTKMSPDVMHARSFGWVMAAALGTIAIIRYVWVGAVTWWLIGLGAGFLVLSLAVPAWLVPIRAIWMKFAMILGAINQRILMTLVFIILIVPVAVLMRLLRKQPIATDARLEAPSYWHVRDQREFTPARMERQF